MVCNNCGQDIPDHSIFCLYCGTPIKEGAVPAHKKNEGNALVRMFYHLYANSGCLSFTISILVILFMLFLVLSVIASYMVMAR